MAHNGLSGANHAPRHRRVRAPSQNLSGRISPIGRQSPPHRLAGSCGTRLDEQLLCRLAALLAARHLRCPAEMVLSAPTRVAPVAAARQLAMYLAHVGLGVPQHQVALGFARHRRTVAHACNRVEDRRDDADFDAQLNDIERQIRWAVGQ